MSEVTLAENLAEKFHAGQLYGALPYTHHLRAVADAVVGEYDDRLTIIALLHDILEDTSCTQALLRSLFDKDIVDAVVAISKIKGESYESYIERVKANALALKVKICDSMCNLTESLKRKDMKRVRKYSYQIHLLA